MWPEKKVEEGSSALRIACIQQFKGKKTKNKNKNKTKQNKKKKNSSKRYWLQQPVTAITTEITYWQTGKQPKNLENKNGKIDN